MTYSQYRSFFVELYLQNDTYFARKKYYEKY